MTTDFAWLFVRMVVGLVFVLALALFLIRYVLARKSSRRGSWVTIVDRFSLESRKHLYLVKIVGRYFVLGSGEQSLNVVAELNSSEGDKIAEHQP